MNRREASPSKSKRNTKLRRDNTSGVCGVTRQNSRRNPWCAQVRVNRSYIRLGGFPTLEYAAQARKVASRPHGFTERHGS